MSLEILGEGFDLHGGGDDLVFPHHENERAQAEAAGHPFARHWIHSGHGRDRRREDVEVARQLHTLADALDASRPPRVPARGAADALPVKHGARADRARRRRRGGRPARRARPARRGLRGSSRGLSDAATWRRSRPRWTTTSARRPRSAVIFDAVRRGQRRDRRRRGRHRRRPARHGRRAGARARPRRRSDGAGAGDDDAEIDALVAARDRGPRGARTSPRPTASATSSRRAASRSRTPPTAPSGTDERPRGPAATSRASGASRSRAATRCASCCGRGGAQVSELWVAPGEGRAGHRRDPRPRRRRRG